MSAPFLIVDHLIQKAIGKQAFSAAQLLVFQNHKPLYSQSYGYRSFYPKALPLGSSPIFDVASLTKPLVTSALFHLLIKDNFFNYSTKLGDFIDCPKDKAKISLGQLVNHRSLLTGWDNFYGALISKGVMQPSLESKKYILDKILQSKARKNLPAKVYSDLGYILLGEIIQKATQKSLKELFDERIAHPLKLQNSHLFEWDSIPQKIIKRAVATEYQPWRNQILMGQVMDEHAYFLGGYAGHAGLFSDADDVFVMLNQWILALKNKPSIFCAKVITQNLSFLPKKTSERYFTLGFDTPNKKSSSGSYFNAQSLGHLGYTGTSFWYDSKRDFGVILLTNRVHPTRENKALNAFRPKLHDLLFSYQHVG